MPKKEKLTRTLVRAPKSQVARDSGAGNLGKDEWELVGQNVWQSIISAIGTRSALDENLRTAYALYERDNRDDGIEDEPYVDSSDLTIPLVFSKLRQQKAEVSSLTFVPEFYLISGTDAESLAYAPDMQTRWNYDFRRIRNPYPSWYLSHDRLLHMGLRDGLSVMEASWVQDKRMQRFRVQTPVSDELGPVIDEATGEIKMQDEYVTMPTVVYDDVVLNPVMLKDVLFMPNEAMSVDQAGAVAIYHQYYESDLRAMVKDGVLNAEWVERALEYDPQGYSDIASRFQGTYNWSAGGQIDVGVGQGQGMSSDRFVNRGPMGVWVVYTNQYDLDGDDIEEPNIVFLQEVSGYMLGHCPDESLLPFRLLFACAPIPRCDSVYGFGVPEIIGPFQAEATLMWNQRNDAVSTRLEVPLLVDSNIEIKDSNMSWGNGKYFYVKGSPGGKLSDVMWYPPMEQVPLASYQQEQQVRNDADMALNAGGTPSGGRQSATEIKQRASQTDLGANEIAMVMRNVSRQIFEAMWSLKLQFGFNPDGTERNPPPGAIPLTKQMMSLPYKRQIAGEDDPLDKQAQLEEVLGFYNLFKESPFVTSDLTHRYNLERSVAGKFGLSGLDGIFGTPQEAAKMKQDQEQAQAKQGEMQMREAAAELTQKLNRRGPQEQPYTPESAMRATDPDKLQPPQQPQQGQPGQQQPGAPQQ